MENNLDRSKIEDKYKWNLELVFKNIDEWNVVFGQASERVPSMIKYKGKLGTHDGLKGYLKDSESIVRQISTLYLYSYLKKDEDNRIAENVSLNDKISNLYSTFSENTSYFSPEILSLSMDYIDTFIEAYPEFKTYRKSFEEMFEERKHILSDEQEEILGAMGENFSVAGDISNILRTSDMKFEPITNEEGNLVELTNGNYANFLSSDCREVRIAACESLMKVYKQFEATLGKTLVGSMKTYNLIARLRNYDSFLNLEFDSQRIPIDVFTNTIETISKNIELTDRFYNIKKEALGLDEMYRYDISAPIQKESNVRYTFEEAIEMVQDATRILGEDYASKLNSIIDKQIIDVYPNSGKGVGAYSYGTYDVPPYILLNFNGKFDDVSTLAHELGHSVNSLYINESQPYHLSGTSLFCAEVASNVNEILLAKHILNSEDDIDVKVAVLSEFVQGIIASMFLQVMYSEFEYEAHDRLANGEALSGADLSALWRRLNIKYNGNSLIHSDLYDLGWARIPHFYNDFYVYKYATGFAAAAKFAYSILNNESGAIDNYIKFLSSGNSDFPVQILQSCNVDLTSKEPVESAIALLNDLLDELEDLLKLQR